MAPEPSRMQRVARTRLAGFELLEWLPTALLVPLALYGVLDGSDGPVQGPPTAVAVTAAGGAIALLWRRRYPLAVLGVVCLAVLLPAAVWGSTHLTATVFSIAVAVFACGAHGRRPWALLAIPLGLATALLHLAFDPIESISTSWTWSLNIFWLYGFGAFLHQGNQLVEQAAAESAALAAAAAAEDRVAIARDLHDVLAHNLAVMIVQAEAADEILDADPRRAHRALEHVQSSGRAAMTDVRGLVAALRDPAATQAGARATPGLESVASLIQATRDSGLPVVLSMSDGLNRVPSRVGGTAYRVIQEALTNTIRHAGPVPTEVSVRVAGTELTVRIHDAGVRSGGANAVGAAAANGTTGHGLRGMRERIEGAGGQLLAAPDPAGGFTVTARMPVPVTA